MKYNFKKAVINAAMIFVGIMIVKLSPYVNVGTGEVDFSIVGNWHFWRHTLFSEFMVTGFAELKYILRWLATMNGNGAVKTP